MLREVFPQQKVHRDDCKQIEEEPGLDVVECDRVDVRLHRVSFLLDILLAETEANIKEKEDFHYVIERNLLHTGRSSKSSVVGIDGDGIGSQEENHEVEDVLPG